MTPIPKKTQDFKGVQWPKDTIEHCKYEHSISMNVIAILIVLD